MTGPDKYQDLVARAESAVKGVKESCAGWRLRRSSMICSDEARREDIDYVRDGARV